MKRINVYTQDEVFEGWFDYYSAEEIASYQKGDPYTYGKILLTTAGGKLIVNAWSNTGLDVYRFAENKAEIAEILSSGGYADDDKKLLEVLSKFEL